MSATTRVRAVLPVVVVDYALTHIGYFVVMPVLPLMLAASLEAQDATWIGLCLGALSLSMRGGSLFVSGWMHRSSVRRLVTVGPILVALGFTVTAYSASPIVVLVALILAGLGFSINGTAVRGYVALRLEDRAAQNTAFSIIQIVVNVAAAVGPIIANLLLDSAWFRMTLVGSAGLFLVAAVVVPCTTPRGSHLAEGATRPPLKLLLVRDLIVDPKLRRLTAVVLAGGFLYGQFFSSFAVMVNEATAEPLLRAGFYTVNAVLVVAAQMLVTTQVNRLMKGGATSVQVLVVGVLLFGGAFALLAVGGGGIAMAYVAIVVFSLGETVYAPMVNTAFVEASEGRPVVEALNLRQVAAATGEGLGAAAGGWLYWEMTSVGREPLYWGALGLFALLTLPMLVNHTRSEPRGR